MRTRSVRGGRGDPRGGRPELPQEPQGEEEGGSGQGPQGPKPLGGAAPYTGHRKRHCLPVVACGPRPPSPQLPEDQTLTGRPHPQLPESATQDTQGSQITAATGQRRSPITAAAPAQPRWREALSSAGTETAGYLPAPAPPLPPPQGTLASTPLLTSPTLILWLRGGGRRGTLRAQDQASHPCRALGGLRMTRRAGKMGRCHRRWRRPLT